VHESTWWKEHLATLLAVLQHCHHTIQPYMWQGQAHDMQRYAGAQLDAKPPVVAECCTKQKPACLCGICSKPLRPGFAIKCSKEAPRHCCGDRDICQLPIVPGPCEQGLPRWGFDIDLGKCVEFIYSGCDGSLNRFDTEEECQTACDGHKPCKKGGDICTSEEECCSGDCTSPLEPRPKRCGIFKG
jgi:hypothetical protein